MSTLMEQTVFNKAYGFDLLNNGYYIENCDYGELYFSKERKEYVEVGYKDGKPVSFKIIEQDIWE